jgi:hypothetical protein
MPIKSRLANPGLLLISVLMVFAGLETYLALFNPTKFFARPYYIQRYFCQHDSLLGWRNKPMREEGMLQ